MLGFGLLLKNKRPLTSADFFRSRVPDRLWGVSVDKIPEGLPHRKKLADYLANIADHVKTGTGLALSGPYGSGKSAGAALVALEVLSYGGTALYIEDKSLADAILDGREYEEEVLFRERAEGVTVLVVDELGLHYNETRASVVESIIRDRISRKRPTVVTTNLAEEVFVKKYQPLYEAMKDSFISVHCAGIDWRALRAGTRVPEEGA